MLASLKNRRAEGIVFKDRNARYASGRPNTGGPQLKHKFYATLSAVVDSVNQKRSVGLVLLGATRAEGGDNGGALRVGNVTIPSNHEIPEVGDVVDVRFLYAYRGGSLYQAVYLGKRDDIDIAECTTSQLKFKAEEPE